MDLASSVSKSLLLHTLLMATLLNGVFLVYVKRSGRLWEDPCAGETVVFVGETEDDPLPFSLGDLSTRRLERSVASLKQQAAARIDRFRRDELDGLIPDVSLESEAFQRARQAYRLMSEAYFVLETIQREESVSERASVLGEIASQLCDLNIMGVHHPPDFTPELSPSDVRSRVARDEGDYVTSGKLLRILSMLRP